MRADKALQSIAHITGQLMHLGGVLEPGAWAELQKLYARMWEEYPRLGAQAVVRFLEALERVPGLKAELGEQLEATKGRPTRGTTRGAAPSLDALGLPPELRRMVYESAAPEPEAPPAALIRYPDLEYPSRVALGTRTALTVSLLPEPPRPEVEALAPIRDGGAAPPRLEVAVYAPGFDFPDGNAQPLEVRRDGPSLALFTLVPLEEGPHTLKARFLQDGRYLGEASCATTVVAQAQAEAPRAVPTVSPIEAPAVAVPPPDLELIVLYNRDANTLSYSLHSQKQAVDAHHKAVGSVRPAKGLEAWAAEVYGELSQIARQPTPESQRRLDDLGRGLWDELVPQPLKDAYWPLRDRVKSLQITSDEPWVPWEMVKPYRFDEAGGRQDEPFLCERFALARWLAGGGPVERLGLVRLQPVVPGPTDLASVGPELEYLQSLGGQRPGLSTAAPFSRVDEVRRAFEQDSFSVLHVASHGGFNPQTPGDSALDLADGELRPSGLRVRFGGARPRPLVFLNACNGARLGFALTRLGGWAEQMVGQARVGAFAGAAWEVSDRLALEFVKAFYDRLLAGEGLGESFRLARLRVRDLEPANSTWLAYVLYADPLAAAQAG